VVAGQATGALGPLVAGRHADPDGSVVSDPALQVGRPVATKDAAIADLNAVAIRAFARRALGMMRTLQLPFTEQGVRLPRIAAPAPFLPFMFRQSQNRHITVRSDSGLRRWPERQRRTTSLKLSRRPAARS
jgi:hypothetical protein